LRSCVWFLGSYFGLRCGLFKACQRVARRREAGGPEWVFPLLNGTSSFSPSGLPIVHCQPMPTNSKTLRRSFSVFSSFEKRRPSNLPFLACCIVSVPLWRRRSASRAHVSSLAPSSTPSLCRSLPRFFAFAPPFSTL